MANEQGTGKHPHKSTKEPYPHNEAGDSGKKNASSGSQSSKSGKQSSAGPDSPESDLKEREYRDNKGEVHHHTHTYNKDK